MKSAPRFAFALLLSAAFCAAEVKRATYDLNAIRDPSTLDLRIIQDWSPARNDASIRQKLIEITVCEWWPGQTIRLPVTFNAPASGEVCRNVIVGNMGMAPRPALPAGAALRLLKEKGVGVVLIGTGEISAMAPGGQLHLGMKQHLLESKDSKFTPAWLWGISHMRALTAAAAEMKVFQPVKVIATGGSKRGIAAIAAGIFDERFTAIMPYVASPLDSPSGPFVLGTGSPEILRLNEDFLASLAAARPPDIPATARQALLDRVQRQADVRITTAEAAAAGWTETDILELNERAWDVIRVTDHLDALRKRGFEMHYIVGTNDNASPALSELGRRYPAFPVYIVPGGQHGGPPTTGFKRQVPSQPEVDRNLYAFCQHHFFGARKLVRPPTIQYRVDSSARRLHVNVKFPDGAEPEKNELWWSVNRNPPLSLAYEYDEWQSTVLSRTGAATYAGELAYPADARSLDFLTTHHELDGKFPLSVSSPLKSVKIGPEQWEGAILEFEQADRAHPPPEGAVLLVGGSNARRWTDVSACFPGKTIINRGFGGASLADLIHYADRVVLRYAPAVIIVNAAANDLKVGTPKAAREACRTFVTKVHARLPGTRIYQISIPPLVSALRVPERMERFRETNRLLRELADEVDGLEFIDLFPAFLAEDGTPRRELYLADGTHLSPKGYEVLASLLRPRL